MTDSANSSDQIAPISALDAVAKHVNATSPSSDVFDAARESASEYGVNVPDPMTGAVLTTLMKLAAARRDRHASAVVVSPAAGVVGLHLLEALPEGGILTCIDPEIEHQNLAKKAFRSANVRANRQRFLPSHPRDVLDRLAPGAYDLVYLDVAPAVILRLQQQAWSLLSPGGILVLPGALLDGTLEDTSRTDRDTTAARDADKALLELEGATVMRLPIAAGTTVLVKD